MNQKDIDPKQIKLIHIAKAQLALSEDDYRTIIGAQTKGKKESSKSLSYSEADSLITYFKTLGFRIKKAKAPRKSPTPANVIRLASSVQKQKIETLKGQICWQFEDGFERWQKKYLHGAPIRTVKDAAKVIEGLKGLLKHQKEGAQTRPSDGQAGI